MKDAKHAVHHSPASLSHVRIAIKDDTLGLRAEYRASQEECRATEIFHDILGRLNGKSMTESEIKKNSAFVDQRWGRLRFVSGGLLVGDELKSLSMEKESLKETTATQEVWPKSSANAVASDHSTPSSAPGQRKSKASRELESEDVQRKAEKSERKLKRKLKRHTKQAMEELTSSKSVNLESPKSPEVKQLGEELFPLEAVPRSQAANNTSQQFQGGRNAVRSRYIQHKKMAFMDNKALNEVSPRISHVPLAFTVTDASQILMIKN